MSVKARYHHGDLRRELLTQAAALLEEVGSDALSVRELARRAGGAPRAPYPHLEHMAALWAAPAVVGYTAFGEALAEAEAIASPGREIEEQAVAYVRFAVTAPGRFRLMFGPRGTEPESDLAAAKARTFHALQVQAGRTLPPTDDVQALAVGYWSFAHGLAMLFLDGRVQEELDGDQDTVVRRVAATFLSRC